MEDFNKIQDYLLNKLSAEDQKNFEQKVAENPELASLLELQRFEMETIDQLEEDSLREKAVGLKNNKEQNNTEAITKKLQPVRSKKRNWAMWAAAASVALLIGFFLFQNPFNFDQNLTAYAYDKENPVYSISSIRASGEEAPVFDNQAINILQSRDQTNATVAIKYFSDFTSNNTNESLRAKMNLGHAFLLNKNFEKAVATFNSLLSSNEVSNRDKEEAAFYQALASLELNTTNGIEKLNVIQKAGKRFSPLAKDILEQVNN